MRIIFGVQISFSSVCMWFSKNSQPNSGDKSIPSLPALYYTKYCQEVLEGHGGPRERGI